MIDDFPVGWRKTLDELTREAQATGRPVGPPETEWARSYERSLKDSVRPRRPGDVVVRPLNFTVRRQLGDTSRVLDVGGTNSKREQTRRGRLRDLVRQRFPCIDHTWRTYLYGAIYVPVAARQPLATLKRDGGEAFLAELEKLAALGSPWAAAFLGYRALLLKEDGTRDIDRAIQLCTGPAASGDAYASYVLGWATYLSGRHAEAITYFRRAARQLFPPAVLDCAGFFWIAYRDKEPLRVLVSLELARDVGARATIVFRSKIYRTGGLGIGRQLFGYLIAPIAYLYWHLAIFCDPFSAQSFSFDARTPSGALGLRE